MAGYWDDTGKRRHRDRRPVSEGPTNRDGREHDHDQRYTPFGASDPHGNDQHSTDFSPTGHGHSHDNLSDVSANDHHNHDGLASDPHGNEAHDPQMMENAGGAPQAQRGTRSGQPSPSNVPIGSRYVVEDEANVQEVAADTTSDGTADTWVTIADNPHRESSNPHSGSASTSHNHDSRYVNESGDTMTGRLTLSEASPDVEFHDSDGASGAFGNRYWAHVNGGNFHILVDRDDDGVWESPHPLVFDGATETFEFGGAVDMGGNSFTEVATIAGPGDPAQVDVDSDMVVLDSANGGQQDSCFHVAGSSPSDALIDLWPDGNAEFAGRVDVADLHTDELLVNNASTNDILIYGAAGAVLEIDRATSDLHMIRHLDGGLDEGSRIEFYAPDHSVGGTGGFLDIVVYNGSGTKTVDVEYEGNNARVHVADGDVLIDQDLDVTGSKNARIPDPDDPAAGYRFAAVESDRPGVLEHEAEVQQGETYQMPAHWPRIADRLRVVSLQPYDSQAGNAWPEIDHTAWTVTVRGQPGAYWMVARADRADPGVDGWQHQIALEE